MSDHLLMECENKGDYMECSVTRLAIAKAEFTAWENSNMCVEPPHGCSVCSLCKDVVADDGWKAHLVNECPANERTSTDQ